VFSLSLKNRPRPCRRRSPSLGVGRRSPSLPSSSSSTELIKQNTKDLVKQKKMPMTAELLKQTHQFVAGKIKRMQFLQHIFLFTVSFLALQSLQ
jgi:hypothetical protein